jgi:hypothetical protein
VGRKGQKTGEKSITAKIRKRKLYSREGLRIEEKKERRKKTLVEIKYIRKCASVDSTSRIYSYAPPVAPHPVYIAKHLHRHCKTRSRFPILDVHIVVSEFSQIF